MKYLSAMVRIIAGCAVIGMSGYVYVQNAEQFSNARSTVNLFGHDLNISGSQALIGVGVCALIGLVLVILGVITARRPTRK